MTAASRQVDQIICTYDDSCVNVFDVIKRGKTGECGSAHFSIGGTWS